LRESCGVWGEGWGFVRLQGVYEFVVYGGALVDWGLLLGIYDLVN